jgi:signal transduction histidine kinase/ligand-binding sensor domain-containing protein/CheY-like chemotaxis protein/AraC-like DNA-binding protein
LGTENGLNRFDPETRVFHWIQQSGASKISLSGDTVQAVFHDSRNRLWIGSTRGMDLYNLESGEFTKNVLQLKNTSYSSQIISVVEIYGDREGSILVGTYSNGLLVLDPVALNVKRILPDPDYQRSYTVRAIHRTGAGELWLGTRGGIYILDEKFRVIHHYVHNLQEQSSLCHNSIYQIFEDREGDIWIASRNGISYANLKKMTFRHIKAAVNNNRSLNDPEVYVITETDDGKLLVGTESGGVNILDKQQGAFRYLTHDEDNENSLSTNCIKSIVQDKEGNYWIGTFHGGLDHYIVKQNRFIHYTHDPDEKNSLSGVSAWALHFDRSANLWIGTSNGLDRFDPGENIFIHYKDSLHIQQGIYVIYEDKDRNLFFFTIKSGLRVMSPGGEIRRYETNGRCIFQDSDGRIWIGSDRNDGLMQFDISQGVVKRYKSPQGLPSNQVIGILEDQSGYLWLSTSKGLSRFDPESEEFKNYRMEDGLQGDKFYYGAYCKCASGELLFGGQNGITCFLPDQLNENRTSPPVIITDFRIFNKPVPIGKEFEGKTILKKSISETSEIKVDYKYAVLTFDYVALNYMSSSKNIYAYMLEGFENEWNYVGSNRTATYTNLDPGTYVFRVKAANNDGVWNETGTSLGITIIPPFHMTLFFKLLIMGGIALIIYLIILFFIKREQLKNKLVIERVQSKELHKIDMMKFQFFTNISHEIRTPVSLIISPLTRIRNSVLSKEQILKDLEVVYRNAVRLGKLIDQLLDFRKIEAGKLRLELSKGDIVTFLKNQLFMFKEMSEQNQVKLEFYSVLDQILIYFDPDKIEKVMFNLLSNAFKHTPAGGTIKVAVSLTYQMNTEFQEETSAVSGEYVQIVIQDTGTGIAESKVGNIFDRYYQGESAEKGASKGSGIGLSLTKELIEIHKGKIQLKSKEGVGTELKILLPALKTDPATKLKSSTGAQTHDHLADCELPVLLILEDDRDLLEFIRSIFEEEYVVLTAENGEQGLELAVQVIPNIIISDVLMPKMDGNKLCRKIKNDFRTSHIPVILLTALSSKQHEKEGILVGADEYISKPFDPCLLKIKVDQMLATRRLLRDKFTRESIMEPNHTATNSPDDRFLMKLVSIVEENISDPYFGITKITREVGVSTTQLYRKIAALTNMTVKEFIRNIRLKRAAQLITQDHLNIAEAAYAVGFLQVAYFRKCFKELYGMNPSEYFKKHESKAS